MNLEGQSLKGRIIRGVEEFLAFISTPAEEKRTHGILVIFEA